MQVSANIAPDIERIALSAFRKLAFCSRSDDALVIEEESLNVRIVSSLGRASASSSDLTTIRLHLHFDTWESWYIGVFN